MLYSDYMFKAIIIAMLLLALISLASALIALFKPEIDRKKMAKALSFRVAFSMVLFAALFFGAYMGWITPHGLYPVVPS